MIEDINNEIYLGLAVGAIKVHKILEVIPESCLDSELTCKEYMYYAAKLLDSGLPL